MGSVYRRVLAVLGHRFMISQKIGRYGPFRIDANFAFSNFSEWGKDHNEGFNACVESCRGRHCVIDVGAHIGLVTLPVASVLAAGGIVIAFEPSRANRAYLERHVAANGYSNRVRIEPFLVGAEKKDNVPFFELGEAAGKNTVVGGMLGDDAQRRLLGQTTIDGFCIGNQIVPDVIKVDVEGAEIEVLKGARQTLIDHGPIVYLSVHPRHIAALGGTIDELLSAIKGAGYECRHIDGSPVAEFSLREYRLARAPETSPIKN